MLDALKQVPLLAGLADDDLQRLADQSEQVSLAAGEVLFEEGSEGDRTYVVESGELEILKQSRNREIRVATSGPGAVIGEMAILQAMPRTATVRAQAGWLLRWRRGVSHSLYAGYAGGMAICYQKQRSRTGWAEGSIHLCGGL